MERCPVREANICSDSQQIIGVHKKWSLAPTLNQMYPVGLYQGFVQDV